MKLFLTSNILAAAVLLAGCATSKSGMTIDTVGPVLGQSAVIGLTKGTLVVYSAYDVNAGFNNRDSRKPVYSDYDIQASDGKSLQTVHNNSGTILQDAVEVGLPPGKYRVKAFANGYEGRVTVPVIIEAGRTTMIHLEGGDFWPDESVFNQTNAVRFHFVFFVATEHVCSPTTSRPL